MQYQIENVYDENAFELLGLLNFIADEDRVLKHFLELRRNRKVA